MGATVACWTTRMRALRGAAEELECRRITIATAPSLAQRSTAILGSLGVSSSARENLTEKIIVHGCQPSACVVATALRATALTEMSRHRRHHNVICKALTERRNSFNFCPCTAEVA